MRWMAVTSGLKLRNVRVDGRRTTVRLEPEIWNALLEISERERADVPEICDIVARSRPGSSFTSGLRVTVVQYFRIASSQGFNAASAWLRASLK